MVPSSVRREQYFRFFFRSFGVFYFLHSQLLTMGCAPLYRKPTGSFENTYLPFVFCRKWNPIYLGFDNKKSEFDNVFRYTFDRTIACSLIICVYCEMRIPFVDPAFVFVIDCRIVDPRLSKQSSFALLFIF